MGIQKCEHAKIVKMLMKTTRILLGAGLLTITMVAGSLLAQDAPDRNQMRDQIRNTDGTVRPPERPVPPAGREIRPDRPQRPERPDRPALPERPALPDEVKALIEKFNTAREEYLAEQKALFEQLRAAAEADRAAIREKIQANREEFLAATRTLREEIRTQMQNLRDQLPSRREVIDQAGPRPGSRPGVN